MAKQIENILIVLNYLWTKTDEKHKSSEKEITDYAKEKYGVDIDHRSIGDALEKIQSYFDYYPDSFPFVLENDGIKRKKYYVERKHFTDDEILKIANAIKNDKYTPEEEANDLIERFIESETSEHKIQDLINMVNESPEKNVKISKATSRKIKLIQEAIKGKCQIKYSLNAKEVKTDYFYKIIYIGAMPYALVIHDNQLASYRIDLMEIIKVEESWHSDPRSKFEVSKLYKGPFTDIEDEIKRLRLPDYEKKYDICEFTFTNNEYCVDMVTNSYREMFHEPLQYEVRGKECYAKMRCIPRIFIRWCTSYDVANIVKVIGGSAIKTELCIHYKYLLHFNKLENVANILWEEDIPKDEKGNIIGIKNQPKK